jgi:plasmid stabilization system protein ParE
MGAKPLEIPPSALEELKLTLSWYVARNETAAVKFAAELHRAIGLLIAAPQRWPTGAHGSRKFEMRRFPFAIFYREKQAVMRLLAVAHGHRRPRFDGRTLCVA